MTAHTTTSPRAGLRPAPTDPKAPGAAAADSLTGILDALGQLARQNEQVKVGDMVGAFGTRSYGPFLIVPALLELSPIGAVPGVPTLLALMVVLFAAQMLFGAKRLWVPGFIERAHFSARRLKKGVHQLRPAARRVDGWFHGRLRRLATGPFVRVAAAGCIALAFTVPLLEVVPFASSIPMAAIALFGLALLVGDGLLVLGACALAVAAAVGVVIWV